MTEVKAKKDHTSAVLITVVLGVIAVFIFGVVFELLKFIAIVKYVFS